MGPGWGRGLAGEMPRPQPATARCVELVWPRPRPRGRDLSATGSVPQTLPTAAGPGFWVFRRSCEGGPEATEAREEPSPHCPGLKGTWASPAPMSNLRPQAPHGAHACKTHLTFLPSLGRRAGSKLEYLRFRGRPGPRLAGLRELSSLLGATGGAVRG